MRRACVTELLYLRLRVWKTDRTDNPWCIVPRSTLQNVSHAGFTLIEMLVVLTVIGLLAATMAPSAFRRPAYLTRERIAAELEQRIAQGFASARASGEPATVNLKGKTDADTPSFVSTIGGAQAPILYPDGSSNGGTVSLAGRPLILIGWIDGRVRRAAS
ncbi:prepilin-type N-terminal cleavage/methylation domain-containing protein [Sphingomonas sp. YR710]|uniref:prepilin-type N-terminal cleavage/methylation domain-containing protein n=1 Tax=Sphingomonas sp. YR710 TaxID=1882773 RepID=UPI0008914B5F|nr:prepilin-type N-terminal cleavage/methylation domain-containing protein [Sphingomonas sp. YR710]SDD73341.1 prepilin-type N-terminal cleavage/methylation domain-containing protein [Sphingomonas sp. YR710]